MKKRYLGPGLIVIMVAAFIYVAMTDKNDADVLQFIRSQGVEIVGKFDTSTELTGYAANYQGEPMSIYLTPDKKHAVIGDLIDADGKNLGSDALYELISAPQNEKIWQQLEHAVWIQDGDPNAKRLIYTFTDPFCPYCHRFRQLADPSIQAGEVQFRHILVGILRDNSLETAATILGAASSEQALASHREHYQAGGIEINRAQASNGNDAVLANNQLMEKLHLQATPTSFYRDENNQIRSIEGLPLPDDLQALFGQD